MHDDFTSTHSSVFSHFLMRKRPAPITHFKHVFVLLLDLHRMRLWRRQTQSSASRMAWTRSWWAAWGPSRRALSCACSLPRRPPSQRYMNVCVCTLMNTVIWLLGFSLHNENQFTTELACRHTRTHTSTFSRTFTRTLHILYRVSHNMLHIGCWSPAIRRRRACLRRQVPHQGQAAAQRQRFWPRFLMVRLLWLLNKTIKGTSKVNRFFFVASVLCLPRATGFLQRGFRLVSPWPTHPSHAVHLSNFDGYPCCSPEAHDSLWHHRRRYFCHCQIVAVMIRYN